MFEMLKKLIRKPSQPHRNSRGQARRFVPTLERLEDRQLLSGSPVLSDASGHLYRLGNDHELYYSASGLGNDWRAIGGPYTAIAGDSLHDVFAMGINHKLYLCTGSSATATMTGVDALLQSYHSNGAQVVTVLDNGALQQSDDGVHFSTIGLGGTITQLAAGQDSAGHQVLFALRQDGALFVDSPTGVTQPLENVRTLIQSYHSNGAPAVTLLAGGQFEQSDNGVNFSTIGLGGTLTQLAAGQDSAGQQVLFALRQDDVLFVDSSTGVTHPLSNVQTLIQSCDGYGTPSVIVLAGGQFEDSHDGVTFGTIGLGGTITQVAQGRNAAGQQVLYALRSDGVLFEDAPTGVSVLAAGVQTLIQSQTGAGVPAIVFLSNGKFQDSTDGNPADIGTIDLKGTITELAQARNSAGQQVFLALRSDGLLFEDAPTGVSIVDFGVRAFHVQPSGPDLYYADYFYDDIPVPPQPYAPPYADPFIGYEFKGSFEVVHTQHTQGGSKQVTQLISVDWALPNTSDPGMPPSTAEAEGMAALQAYEQACVNLAPGLIGITNAQGQVNRYDSSGDIPIGDPSDGSAGSDSSDDSE